MNRLFGFGNGPCGFANTSVGIVDKCRCRNVFVRNIPSFTNDALACDN